MPRRERNVTTISQVGDASPPVEPSRPEPGQAAPPSPGAAQWTGLPGRLFTGRLWRHRDFVKLWTGQSLSQFGTAVTQLALPTAAILLLHAGAFQVGVLGALQFLAFPMLGLVAGVWADRLRRRPIMILCDAVRLLALGSIPLSWFLGALTIWQLYAVAAVTGVATVFFDVAYQSYLPALVDRQDLLEANSKLEVTRSLSQAVGPALAGLMIQALQAANAIIADSISYLASVATLLWIHKPEPGGSGLRRSFIGEIWDGTRFVFGHRMIRLIAGSTATYNLGANTAMAVLILWLYREIHVSPAQVGVIFTIGSFGAVLGSILALPIAQWIGMGPTLAISTFVASVPTLLYPLAGASAFPIGFLAALSFIAFGANPIYNVNQVSYRQAAAPIHVQGRLNATVRTLIWGTIPIGMFVGGVLGSYIGLVPTIYVGSAIATLSVPWILAGPVRIN